MNSVFLFALITLAFFTVNLSYAQLGVDNTTDKKAFKIIGLNSPLIQKISDKGIYNITLKSGQSPFLSGLNFEIVFLNASSRNMDTPASGAESNTTTDTLSASGLTIPSVVEHVIPVKSFDVAITSNDGKELFKKTDEIPRGGRILENVNLNGYTGNITISLYNIVPDSGITDIIKKQLQVSNDTAVVDSAKFQTEVLKS
jgi:hypothetical protein